MQWPCDPSAVELQTDEIVDAINSAYSHMAASEALLRSEMSRVMFGLVGADKPDEDALHSGEVTYKVRRSGNNSVFQNVMIYNIMPPNLHLHKNVLYD